MKSTINLLLLMFGVLLANIAHAESPREQLQQMAMQLQQSPNDNALRERIIKLAPTLKTLLSMLDTAIPQQEHEAALRFPILKSRSQSL